MDLAQVNGTGVKQRILHDDVKAFVKAILTGGGLPGGGPSAGGSRGFPAVSVMGVDIGAGLNILFDFLACLRGT